MKVSLVGEKIDFKLKRKIVNAIKLCLIHLGQELKKIEVAITFISPEEMRELNSRTRGIDKVTDVLSFPNFNLKAFSVLDINNKENYTGKHIFLGDMAICVNRAEEQAKEYGWSLEDEIVKLVIHSILHMMGFDHIGDSDYEVMKQEEEKIATKFYTNKKI